MGGEIYGAVEAGGTKFICAVGTAPDDITNQLQIATTSPNETLKAVFSFFKNQPQLKTVGLASFGPVDLDEHSSTYGKIAATPKAGWQNTDILGLMKSGLNVPVAIGSDVSCAALGEQLYGAGKGLKHVAYMTVGTGIGIGSVIEVSGRQELANIEMGHMLIPRLSGDDKASACSYHESCLEGFASGTALHSRWGALADTLDNGLAWQQEAEYLAAGLVNTILSLMPERIVLGGGVMNHQGLIDNVRRHTVKLLNGYVDNPAIHEIDKYIVLPALGNLSGVTGAMALAKKIN